MLFFSRKSHKEIEQDIHHKEVLIEHKKKNLHKRVDQDLNTIKKLNRVLGNGITLSIHQATGGHKNG